MAGLLGRVELAVGAGGGAAPDRAEVEGPQRLARLLVQRVQVGGVVHDVDPAVADRGGGEADRDPVGAPDLAGLRDVAPAPRVDRHHAAHEARQVHVLLAVGRVDDVALHEGRGVDAAHAEVELPDGLARARVDRVQPPVGGSGDHQPTPVDDSDRGARVVVRVLERTVGRRRDPAHGPGALVERHVPLARARHVAPARADDAEDEPVLVDDRDQGATAEARAPSELLAEPALPDRLPGAVEGDELPVHVLGVDVARLGVAGEARPADAAEGDSGVVDGEASFPELLSGARVEAGDELLPEQAGPRASADAGPAVEDDGRGPGGDVLLREVRLPDQVLARLRPGRDEALLPGGAVAMRAAPARPVARGGERRRGREGRSDGQAQCRSCLHRAGLLRWKGLNA